MDVGLTSSTSHLIGPSVDEEGEDEGRPVTRPRYLCRGGGTLQDNPLTLSDPMLDKRIDSFKTS